MRSFTYPEFCAALTGAGGQAHRPRVAVRKPALRSPAKG